MYNTVNKGCARTIYPPLAILVVKNQYLSATLVNASNLVTWSHFDPITSYFWPHNFIQLPNKVIMASRIMFPTQQSHSEHLKMRPQAEPLAMISDLESSSDSDSEAASDFDLDPIEEEVSELELVSLDTTETAVNVEAPRIERLVVPAGGSLKARSKRPSGLVYTGNSKRTQRYRAAKNAADKKEMDQNNKLMIAAQRPLTKYKETKISSFFKPLQPNKSIQEENSEEESIQEENSEEEFEPSAPGMDFFDTDDSDDSEYHPPNKHEKRSRAPTAKTSRNHKQNLEYMVAHRILPKDVRPGNKKLVWQNTLQLNRVNGLISFYNLILCGYRRRIASQLASQGMGKMVHISCADGLETLRDMIRYLHRKEVLTVRV